MSRRLSALAEPGHDAPSLDLQLSVSHAYAVEKREEDGFSVVVTHNEIKAKG